MLGVRLGAHRATVPSMAVPEVVEAPLGGCHFVACHRSCSCRPALFLISVQVLGATDVAQQFTSEEQRESFRSEMSSNRGVAWCWIGSGLV